MLTYSYLKRVLNMVTTAKTAQLRDWFGHRPSWKQSTLCLAIAFSFCQLAIINTATAATYYLDAANGSDSNPGTSAQPWKTLARAYDSNTLTPNVEPGDTVYLKDGNYGAYSEPLTTSRSNWITYKAATGHTPQFTYISITHSPDKGNSYLRFKGITVQTREADEAVVGTDGYIKLNNSAYIEFEDINLIGHGYLNDSVNVKGFALWHSDYIKLTNCMVTGIDTEHFGAFRSGIYSDTCANVEVLGCSITRCFDAVRISGSQWVIQNNHIYNLDNDGILINECNTVLIAYNHIHNLTRPNDSNSSSLDLIQAQNVPSHNITIRGNICHDSDAQGFFINPTTASTYLIENNLLYNTGRVVPTCHTVQVQGISGLVFRNNTVDGFVVSEKPTGITSFTGNIIKTLDLYTDNGNVTVNYENSNVVRSWWIHMTNHAKGVSSVTLQSDAEFYGLFSNAKSGNYQLANGSRAINICDPANSPLSDILGHSRDSSPDAGCYEYVSSPRVGLWKFDEGSGLYANDSSGYSITGRLLNGPLWTTQGEISFDGNNDAVEINTATLNISNGTVALWVNPRGFSKSKHYLFGHLTQPANNRIQLFCNASGTLGVGLGNNASTNTNIQTLNTQEWYHIALTWSNTSYAVFVDGQQKASGTFSGISAKQTYADIGNSGNRSQLSEAFYGRIDEVRLYNRAISADEVANHALVFLPIGNKTIGEGEILTFPVKTKFGTIVEISDSNLPYNPSFTSNVFTWTPDYDDAGSYEVEFAASHDSNEDFERITVTVTDTQQKEPVGALAIQRDKR